MESSVQRVLTKNDFAWLDLPSPVPLDTVRNAPADQLLSLVGEATFISDMVAPLIDPRPSTGNFQTGVGSNMLTSTKLVPRKGASAAWLDELNDILAAQQLIATHCCDKGATATDLRTNYNDVSWLPRLHMR